MAFPSFSCRLSVAEIQKCFSLWLWVLYKILLYKDYTHISYLNKYYNYFLKDGLIENKNIFLFSKLEKNTQEKCRKV